MVSALLLDAYGTIIDTGDGSVRATERILRRRGSSLDPREVYARWKAIHRQHLRTLTEFVAEEDVFRMDLEKLYDEYGIDGDPATDVSVMLDTLGVRTAFPEVRAVMRELKNRAQVFVASNSDSDPLLSDVSRNRIGVDGVYSSERLQAYKPRPEFYERLLDCIGLRCEQAVFVGDSPQEDVAVPMELGMQAVWVKRSRTPTDQASLTPLATISTLRELPEAIASLLG